MDDSPAARYYPSCTTLADGRVLAVAGSCVVNDPAGRANTPMIFKPNPPAGDPQWTELTDAAYCPWFNENCFPPGPNSNKNFHIKYYPFDFLLSNGKVLVAQADDACYRTSNGSSPKTRLLTPIEKLEQWEEIGSGQTDVIRGESAVMFRPDLIMKAGGEVPPDSGNPPFCESCPCFHGFDSLVGTDKVFVIDGSAREPRWEEIAPLYQGRNNFYLIVLPDGKVLAVGGSSFNGFCQQTCFEGCGDNVYLPELYDPDHPQDGWKLMAPLDVARRYHSSAVLLYDGRVLVAGGTTDINQRTAQIYSPPYLFTLAGPPAERPVITEVLGPEPNTLHFGTKFTIRSPDAARVTQLSLIRLGAATHSYDHSQRYIPIIYKADGADEIVAAAPNTGYLAPLGHYYLFILVDGVPSKAAIVQVKM